MLRLSHGRLSWSDADTTAMDSILGPDAAATQHSPVNAALIKAAARRGLHLSPKTTRLLERAEDVHHAAEALKVLPDAPNAYRWERAFVHQRVAINLFDVMQRMHGVTAFLNADKTGVGKTLDALLWAHNVLRAERVLIITKNGAKLQWIDAIHEFIPFSKYAVITNVEGTIPEQTALAATRRGWVVGHWQSLVHAAKGYRKRPWDAIILDEAHYIGNPTSYAALVAPRLRSEHRMAMTANPYTNHPGELFAILRFLYPQIYTSYWRFFNMYVKASPMRFGGMDIQGVKRTKLLRWELSPFTIARTKQQVYASLPAIARVRRTVTLSPRGVREYGRLKKQFFAELDKLDGGTKLLPIINDLARLTRIRQYLIDPGLIGAAEKPIKYEEMTDLSDELSDPLVIFTSYRQAALRLGAYLRKKRGKKFVVDYIHGGITLDKRHIAKKRFLHGDVNALIVVTQAGGEALNLGKYGLVAHLDLPWTPRDLEQTEGRVDRPEEGTGNLVPTTAYRIIVKDSYEERMEQKLAQKHDAFVKVFTISDLRELFA